MAELGLDAYRFSIAWPRVVPAGTGAVNEAGLDFYDRLVDALLERGHRAPRDALPLGPAAGARGRRRLAGPGDGRRVRRLRRRRGAAAWATASRRLATLNEPWCSSLPRLRATGSMPPGAPTGAASLAAAHHLLVAHGMAHAGDPCRRAPPAGRDRPQLRAAAARRATHPLDLEAAAFAHDHVQPLVPGPADRRRLPGGRGPRAGLAARRGAARATWRRSRRRSTSWASTTTRATLDALAAPAAAGAAGRTGSRRGWAGRSTRTA